MKLHGLFLNNLRVADGMFLCTGTPHELQHMLQEWSDENGQMGVIMNIAKTNPMVVDDIPKNVNKVLMVKVTYTDLYMGQP